MSSYRKRTQAKPTTAAGLRAQASANGSSIFRNRPRSISGLFGPNQNSYSSLLGVQSSNPYLKKNYSKSTNNLNYSNPYSVYGGTASGYGGLTLPSHSSINSLNLATPTSNYYLGHGNNFNSNRSNIKRGGSFNRSKTKPQLNFGSRSSSLQSLTGSEGYISGQERSGRSSRLGSVSSLSSETPSSPARTKSVTSENGELDYKKLYEESQVENERLREKLRRSDDQLKEVRNLLDKAQSAQNKNNLSETEKRERRAMERKLSEMEEELKVMEQLKCENQKLKDENGALIRVISKLSK